MYHLEGIIHKYTEFLSDLNLISRINSVYMRIIEHGRAVAFLSLSNLQSLIMTEVINDYSKKHRQGNDLTKFFSTFTKYSLISFRFHWRALRAYASIFWID